MFNFPNTPAAGDIYAPAGAPAYQWDGQKWVMAGSALAYTPAYAQRNRLVNGGVQINQELGFGTGSNTAGAYTADQWLANWSGPTGGTHVSHVAYKGQTGIFSQATAYTSVAAGNFAVFLQPIEGIRIADFLWGTVAARAAILRFEAWCDVAGTYAVAIRSSNADRSIVFPITIAAGEVSTWKSFVFPIPAITSGTFPTDNTRALDVTFTAMCGTTFQTAVSGAWQSGQFFGLTGMSNLLASVPSKALYVKNIGLYLDAAGNGIPPRWEMPDEASELAACMRYYFGAGAGVGEYTQWSGVTISGVGYRSFTTQFPVRMRTTPAISLVDTGVATGFPATPGTTAVIGNAFYEFRTANAATNSGLFRSNFVANARM